ncbi:SbcC/MukB-like Walker B domain-containing protein [Nonomuraea sp. NPDC050310]|uniref:ATP-binding protein n=1 Tax=Nonomuraea sp. NPDC050310 TaxID=3154935 RepID=UPI0033D0BA79
MTTPPVTTEPLLHLHGTSEGTTQWKAETFQMVNWGGFQDHHQVEFSQRATLISGASGTGKSTLLDGYIALMMPSTTPFNGASNEATSGRARSVDQRNLLTYLRGKTDSARQQGTDEVHDCVLRGKDAPTWGAVAMTFVDDNGLRYTALRAYYVGRGVSRATDVTMKMGTAEGCLNLKDLAPLAESKFDKRASAARLPALTWHDQYEVFEQILFTRLGIGASGDGRKALRLLARIQGGHQVKTVDGLYKSMVLEEPATYAAADRAITHFEDLERAHDAMETVAEKATVLRDLPLLHQDLQEATQKADAVELLGISGDGDTAFRVWTLTTERSLLAEAVKANRASREVVHGKRAEALARESALKAEIEELKRQIRDHGGDTLDKLHQDVQELESDLGQARHKRERFDGRIQPLTVAMGSQQDFLRLRTAAAQFTATFARAVKDLEQQQQVIQRDKFPHEEQERQLKEEQRSLSGREGLVPTHLHNARVMIAQACGIPVENLPFVAELIDLAPGQEAWRKAAEVILAPITRVMLVDEERLGTLSRTIDPLRLSVRITFEGVPLGRPEEFNGDPRRISGKLMFKDSLFGRWVQQRVQASTLDARCVEGPAELNSGGRCVTPNGQTRDGRRGAHGDPAGGRYIIGFSNTARLAEIDENLAQLRVILDDMEQQATAVGDKIADLRRRKEAFQFVLDTEWQDIDVAGVEAKIAAKEAERKRILSTSDILRALQEEAERKTAEHEQSQRTKHLAEQEVDDLDKAYMNLTQRESSVCTDIDAIDCARLMPLREELLVYLDKEFSHVADRSDLPGFPDGVRRLRGRLGHLMKQERDNAQKARDSLERIFQTFQSRWPDPNLGQAMASYSAYRDILDDILTTGLHERRQEWKRRLSKWSGEDLVPLNGAFDTSIEEIEDRLYPVNEILATLAFGAGRDRLKIVLRRLHRDDITKFRRELKLLSSGVTEKLTDEQAEARFKRLRAFMNQIRKPQQGSKGTPLRDHLLDVRRHVEITAARLSTEGIEISTYASLGGKSGGETQELIAFIVGAALRFQLGDESRTRPRFAPVILDEGFIKADSEFAGRAVQAWKGLGFQLIIGAPLDKVTALEPHVDLVIAVTKDNRTNYSYITKLASLTGAAP